jgi:hypothetical protein
MALRAARSWIALPLVGLVVLVAGAAFARTVLQADGELGPTSGSAPLAGLVFGAASALVALLGFGFAPGRSACARAAVLLAGGRPELTRNETTYLDIRSRQAGESSALRELGEALLREGRSDAAAFRLLAPLAGAALALPTVATAIAWLVWGLFGLAAGLA